MTPSSTKPDHKEFGGYPQAFGIALLVLIYSDVPFRSGDSGGPLLSIAGELIGVNTAVERALTRNSLNSLADFEFRRVSFFPDKQFVECIIADDRAKHAALNDLHVLPPSGTGK